MPDPTNPVTQAIDELIVDAQKQQDRDTLAKVTQPPHEAMLEWFEFEHLPEGPMRGTSQLFADLARTLVATVRPCAERTVALRKLLEGKDAAVRAAKPRKVPT